MRKKLIILRKLEFNQILVGDLGDIQQDSTKQAGKQTNRAHGSYTEQFT
jgi:hypothetical protein